MDKNTTQYSSVRDEKKKAVDKPKLGQVVAGSEHVTRRKTSAVKKLGSTFFAETTANVGKYIVQDVLLPAVKDMFFDVFIGSIEMKMFGRTTPRRDRPRPSLGGNGAPWSSNNVTNYGGYSAGRTDNASYQGRAKNSYGARGFNLDEVHLDSRLTAERVLEVLDERLADLGEVSVADYYDCLGLTTEHTDHNYGWRNLRNAKIKYTKQGYIIDMPDPTAINK